jgi:hypothetical protein
MPGDDGAAAIVDRHQGDLGAVREPRALLDEELAQHSLQFVPDSCRHDGGG